jgi:hypothetical protein
MAQPVRKSGLWHLKYGLSTETMDSARWHSLSESMNLNMDKLFHDIIFLRTRTNRTKPRHFVALDCRLWYIFTFLVEIFFCKFSIAPWRGIFLEEVLGLQSGACGKCKRRARTKFFGSPVRADSLSNSWKQIQCPLAHTMYKVRAQFFRNFAIATRMGSSHRRVRSQMWSY